MKKLFLILLLIFLVGCVEEMQIEPTGIQTEKEIPKESKVKEEDILWNINKPQCPGISITAQCYKGGLQVHHAGEGVPINKFKVITDKYGEELYDIYMAPPSTTLFGENKYYSTNITIIPITIENREEIVCDDNLVKITCPQIDNPED